MFCPRPRFRARIKPFNPKRYLAEYREKTFFRLEWPLYVAARLRGSRVDPVIRVQPYVFVTHPKREESWRLRERVLEVAAQELRNTYSLTVVLESKEGPAYISSSYIQRGAYRSCENVD